MLVHIPHILSASQLDQVHTTLAQAGDAWVDGRITAGFQGAPVKRNQQIDEHSAFARALGDMIVGQLERNPLFISACLPHAIYPPMFNRYGEGMHFGSHVDGAIRVVPGQHGQKLRTDISCTLFLTDPTSYDGGELEIDDTYGAHRVKLAAGDMIAYPASSVHRVTPVTRGERVACFFWVQSMVRDDQQRAQLYALDGAIQTLNQTQADEGARTTLVGHYHNLLRMWADA
ncbi:MAG: Fe2+-dependent dioxygenase [Burkholderiales bacterium]|nr:Fe2+-dependent dioxygenase [Burkholderiales bacterium]